MIFAGTNECHDVYDDEGRANSQVHLPYQCPFVNIGALPPLVNGQSTELLGVFFSYRSIKRVLSKTINFKDRNLKKIKKIDEVLVGLCKARKARGVVTDEKMKWHSSSNNVNNYGS